MTDIFDFWSSIRRGETIHPADRDIFARIDAKKHGFRTDCLPACYAGRLCSAPIVLLYLSPGFCPQDLTDASSDEGKDYYLRRWTGNEPLPGVGYAGHTWLKSRTKDFANYNTVMNKIAVLNIGAYHSTNVNSYSSLLALPSSRISLTWAQNVLFPEAEAGKRIVICMRSAAYWGLEAEKAYGKALFAPSVTRNGYLVEDNANQKIIQKVRERLRSTE
jgi:hypothetical protein